jgi:hypothetical protein
VDGHVFRGYSVAEAQSGMVNLIRIRRLSLDWLTAP